MPDFSPLYPHTLQTFQHWSRTVHTPTKHFMNRLAMVRFPSPLRSHLVARPLECKKRGVLLNLLPSNDIYYGCLRDRLGHPPESPPNPRRECSLDVTCEHLSVEGHQLVLCSGPRWSTELCSVEPGEQCRQFTISTSREVHKCPHLSESHRILQYGVTAAALPLPEVNKDLMNFGSRNVVTNNKQWL